MDKNKAFQFTQDDILAVEEGYLSPFEPHGHPAQKGKCFICGNFANVRKGICPSCAKEFPIKKKTTKPIGVNGEMMTVDVRDSHKVEQVGSIPTLATKT